MKKQIGMWIIFGFLYLIISMALIFYLDMANGPMYLLFIEIGLLILMLVIAITIRNQKFRWRILLFLVLLILNIPIFSLAHPATVSFKPTTNIVVTDNLHLANGDIVGTYNDDKSVMIYAGIPYAKAPVGPLRFKEPVDVSNWDGVLDCTFFAPRAMQNDRSAVIDTIVDMYAEKSWHPNFKMVPRQDMSEDCLYLNIWKPNTDEVNLPIVVYIHGGSLTSGSSAFGDYNGETYAKNGVIMITISYRLGVFGYFAHPDLATESPNNTTGNYGLLDQIKALEWINKNASYFGGDKDNITIAGESAGSSSISALCTSPLAKNLFKRAIGESSSLAVITPPHTFRTIEEAYETGKNLMEEFGCSSIEELRKIDATKLVKTEYTNSSMTIDGYALTKSPYEAYKAHENNEEALLNGYNVKEADAFVVPMFLLSPTNKDNIKDRLNDYFGKEIGDMIFSLYKDKIEEDAFSAFNEIISVYWFIYPHHSWSNLAMDNGVKVYRYQFTKENGYYGTYHSGEMIYVYGNLYRSLHPYAYNEDDYLLQDKMVKYFTNFIKTGNPNGEGLVEWPLYNNIDNKVMELGENVGLINDEYLGLYYLMYKYLTEEKDKE